MLIMVFVFGCVTFAHAETTDNYVYGEDSYTYINDSDPHIMALCVRNIDRYDTIFVTNLMGRIAFLRKNVNGYYSFYMYTENIESSNMSMMVYNTCSFPKNGKYYSGFASSSGPYNSCFVGTSFASYRVDNGELVSSNVVIFDDFDDLNVYLNTGEVNNPIYDNRPIEYDESVELPLSAQCQVNGDLFLFNCKQSVAHSDYTIQLSADCRLTPIYSNFASKSYADTKQSYRTNKNEIGKYDNHGISFNTSFSTTDLLNGVDTSRKALGFKEFYNGIYINLPYEKCTLSEIVFYARNICGNKCSNWVRVTYDLVNETSKYEEIESVTGSNVPSDTKHNNSEYYPDDYLYNDDEAFNSGSNITNTLTNLKTNYASLVNFYKDLFSFLPGEVWALLIGLVGAMVILALVIFIRG